MAKELKVNPYFLNPKYNDADRKDPEIKWENEPSSIWGNDGYIDAFKLDPRAWKAGLYRTTEEDHRWAINTHVN